LLFKNIGTLKICWSFKLFLHKKIRVFAGRKIKNYLLSI